MDVEIDTPRGPVGGAWTAGDPVVVVAHGAGNDMHSPLLVAFTDGLADAGVGSLRFNFPYKEAGRRAPDPPQALLDASRAAFEEATRRAGSHDVVVGGKSLGGRIASLLVADGLPAAGLVFLGYPLHAPGKTERLRDEHLGRIDVPMLFLEGTRDPFARWDLIEAVCRKLGDRAVLYPVEGGDHSFRVRGEKVPDDEIGRRLAEVTARFVRGAAV
ncbi:MAG: alpha/beta family hydrolase [Actinomycetota bacterium]